MNANAIQRLWCTTLLARTPASLGTVQRNVHATRAWLEKHPTRTLHHVYRERLLRYEKILDVHEVNRPREVRATATKSQPKQLTLTTWKERR